MAGIAATIGILEGIEFRTIKTVPEVARAMGDTYRDHLQNVTLRRTAHGMYTYTPSPPGAPPSFVSGELAYSITVTVSPGWPRASSEVAPHTVYAAIQEFGGDTWPDHSKFMRWFMEGQYWYKKIVHLPERPYMRPALEEVIASGELQDAAVTAFREGMGM
jgi:hypothetical protein